MSTREEPGKKFRFLVEIDGVAQVKFHEVVLPDMITEVIEYREGSEGPVKRKLPGQTKYGNLILKSSVTNSIELYEWYMLVTKGAINNARRNVSVILLDDQGNEYARWNFVKAWPCRYSPPDLNASENSVALETLEITHEGMRRVK